MIKGTFLGTGSIPTVERNSQGVLLDFDNKTTVLVDCGEGIQRQLLKINTDLEKLDAIFLTHNHIDHVYGMGGVLTLLLLRYPKKKVKVYAPDDTIGIVKQIVDLFMPEKQSRIEYIGVKDKDKIETDEYICRVFKTWHTETSLGYCFESGSKKVALFGDVGLPDDNVHDEMTKAIYGADIAIIDGVHITVEEASKLGKGANVKELFLLPILLNKTTAEVLEEASINFKNTKIPNDFEEFILK